MYSGAPCRPHDTHSLPYLVLGMWEFSHELLFLPRFRNQSGKGYSELNTRNLESTGCAVLISPYSPYLLQGRAGQLVVYVCKRRRSTHARPTGLRAMKIGLLPQLVENARLT